MSLRLLRPGRPVAVLALATGLALASAAAAAPPSVPDRISYQGVLLDDSGSPRTGPVDLTVRIFDGLLAGATLLYVQHFAAVPLADGVFSLEIGPTGDATDAPTDPLTTSLAEVFAGDLVAAPGRFLELTADGDTAQVRVQILSAPLALRALSAETADSAATATTAANVTSINGLDPVALNEIFQHFDFDGGAPPNDDPREGTSDTDGDGMANFVDPDNDDDGVPDVDELADGSDINLVTPTVSGVSPAVTDFGFPATVTVSGTNFEPGLSVAFGTQTPAPTNVTPTSFDVTVGPQPQGFPDVQVTLPNGESGTGSGLFEFAPFTPTVVSATPSDAFATETVTVTVTGTNFEPGMTVDFGTESPTPANVTPTSFDVTVGPQPVGFATIVVTRQNGVSGIGEALFDFRDPLQGTSFPHGSPGPVSSLDARASGASLVGEFVDADGDRSWTVDALVDPPSTVAGTFDLAFDDADVLAGLIAITPSGPCEVQVRRDTDANDRVFAGESVAIESFDFDDQGLPGDCQLTSASLDFLSNGGAVAAYSRSGRDVVVAADYDGDAGFGGAGEQLVAANGLSGVTLEAAVDASDRVAVAFRSEAGGGEARLLHDRSGDGDFGDAGEDLALASGVAVGCLDVAFAPSGGVAVVFQEAGSPGTTLLLDRNGDGDFDDADELQSFGSQAGGQCAMTTLSTGLALVHDADPAGYRILADLDGDGRFLGTGENVGLAPSEGDAVNIESDGAGTLYTATETQVFVSAPLP